MKRMILAVALSHAVSAAPLSAPAPPPLCTVVATASPAIVGRWLTVQLKPGCPPNGVARLRLVSKLGGSQPDFPPGLYTLYPGQTFRKVALSWWSLVWVDRIGREWRVSEQQ
ncbi:hypothetical protein [Deinococcus sp. QL22]|uniref:hypothetical protein n=1 Tax=Deinococcus sp. QL22 TaxID=2939437 RepID=UPI0020175C7A|nr:hypothetical protein [Deinococcus sp. QL22]UQN06750.1 hypothetical protein M1R55_02175 [Deinococcus sp. QL22]